jgi:hypothetical protein
VNIVGATGSTYSLTSSVVGHKIDVIVSVSGQTFTSPPTPDIEPVNTSPTGSVAFSGSTVLGQTLTASNTLADVDGIPTSGAKSIQYQWQDDGINISGATSSTYTLKSSDVGHRISVVASYTDNGGVLESKASTSAEVKPKESPTSTIQGVVYQWNNHVNLSGVNITAQEQSTLATTGLIQLKNITWDSMGHGTADVYLNASAPVNSFGFDFQINGATSTNFLASSAITSSWITTPNAQSNDIQFGAFNGDFQTPAITDISSNAKIGTIIFETGSNASQVTLNLVSGNTSNDASVADYASSFNTLIEHVSTSSTGAYQLTNLPADTFGIVATQTITSTDAKAITPLDALAALKISVGLNPNAPSTAGNIPLVSPYQYLAADVTGDGKVTPLDALAILKMSVNLPGSVSPSWLFVNEAQSFSYNSTKKAFSLTAQNDSANTSISVVTPPNQTLNVVGILMGDVNGSWGASSPATTHVDYNSTTGALNPTYWSTLATNLQTVPDQWGVVI